MRYQGNSVQRVREIFAPGEFGFNTIMGGCLALTHPERFTNAWELDISCPGDRFNPFGNNDFSEAPSFTFSAGPDPDVAFSPELEFVTNLKFTTEFVDFSYQGIAPATGYFPF